MKLSELRLKEVINVRDARKIGFVDDIEIEKENGKILSLVVYPGAKVAGLFGKQDEVSIPWSNVKLIGDDIVLVDTE